MKHPQPQRILSIDDLYHILPDNERTMVSHIIELVNMHSVGLTWHMKYNVPFAYGKKRILFIWPSTIPWGKVPKGKVHVGWCQAHQFPTDVQAYLNFEQRKQVGVLPFSKPADIKQSEFLTILQTAIEVDSDKKKST